MFDARLCAYCVCVSESVFLCISLVCPIQITKCTRINSFCWKCIEIMSVQVGERAIEQWTEVKKGIASLFSCIIRLWYYNSMFWMFLMPPPHLVARMMNINMLSAEAWWFFFVKKTQTHSNTQANLKLLRNTTANIVEKVTIIMRNHENSSSNLHAKSIFSENTHKHSREREKEREKQNRIWKWMQYAITVARIPNKILVGMW